MADFTVADVVLNQLDGTGVPVKAVYCKVPPQYAVYATDTQLVIQFADDKQKADV
jgi:hypothetical protein